MWVCVAVSPLRICLAVNVGRRGKKKAQCMSEPWDPASEVVLGPGKF